MEDVETYYEAGQWKCRWVNGREPFATGTDRQRLIAQGATVAHWYAVDHIIRDASGAIEERNSYRNAGDCSEPLLETPHKPATSRRASA